MRRLPLALLLTTAWAAAAVAQPFQFVALGDMPYTLPDDYPRVERLIDAINRRAPAFSIHVGDTKSGGTPCSDAVIQRAKDLFDRFQGAVVYTPGDNEWTDCHRPKAGGFDPLERLDYLRRTHFDKPQSLGQKPIALVRQADVDPRFARYVENSRWSHQGVLFVATHVVGSNNNFETRPGAPEEYAARNAANLAWIADAFAQAAKPETLGLVFAMQADLWAERNGRLDRSSGFSDTVEALAKGARALDKPVLIVNGDSHVLAFEQLLKDAKNQPLPNAYRLQVMGANDVGAVVVTVDPNGPSLFGVTPLRAAR